MSYATATPAQRLALRDHSLKLAVLTQPAAQRADLFVGEETAVDAQAALSLAAFSAAGYSAVLPATQVTLSSGQKVNAVSVTGTGNFATFTIVAGAITAIVLSES